MEKIIRKLNEIDENPLMKKEIKKLCKAYATEVVRYFEARQRDRQRKSKPFQLG